MLVHNTLNKICDKNNKFYYQSTFKIMGNINSTGSQNNDMGPHIRCNIVNIFQNKFSKIKDIIRIVLSRYQ